MTTAPTARPTGSGSEWPPGGVRVCQERSGAQRDAGDACSVRRTVCAASPSAQRLCVTGRCAVACLRPRCMCRHCIDNQPGGKAFGNDVYRPIMAQVSLEEVILKVSGVQRWGDRTTATPLCSVAAAAVAVARAAPSSALLNHPGWDGEPTPNSSTPPVG